MPSARRVVGLGLGGHVLARQHDKAAAQAHARPDPGQGRHAGILLQNRAVDLAAKAQKHLLVRVGVSRNVGALQANPGRAFHRRAVSQNDSLADFYTFNAQGLHLLAVRQPA